MYHSSPLAFVAIQAALKAGEILRRGFGTEYSVSSKTNTQDLVTPFDHAAEEAIIKLISTEFPDHAFLAEESGSHQQENSEVLWVIDPLDGTLNFAHHIPVFAISIAALVDGKSEVGVLYQPMTNELFTAQRGLGAYLNGTKISVSTVDVIQQAIGATGFPYEMGASRQLSLQQFFRILHLAHPIRMMGSSALNLAYVAAGRFDFSWGINLKPWDTAAGTLLVEEAGGRISHFDGSPHELFTQPSIVASNPHLHDLFLSYL